MDTIGTIDARIANVAAQHSGLVTAAQLRNIRVGRASVQRRLASGLLALVVPRVYAVGSAAISDEMRAVAAVLAAGPGAALSHETAACRLHVWIRGTRAIHVVSTTHHTSSDPDAFVYHRTRYLPGAHVQIERGVRTTSFPRTYVDLGTTHTSFQLAAVLHEAAFRQVLDLKAIGRVLDSRSGTPGTAVARAGIELHRAGSAGTRSRTEDRLVAELLAAALPLPLVNVRNATGMPGIEADFVWTHARLVVEVDGSGHQRPGAGAWDAARDDALIAHGWRVRRFSARHIWHDIDLVLGEISQALA